MKIPLAYKLMPYLASKMMKKTFNEEAGFKSETIQISKGIWRINMTKCFYYDTLKKYDYASFCKIFSKTDDICNENLHPKLIWNRTKTIGFGYEYCDFCLKVS